MARERVTAQQFIAIWRELRSAGKVAERIGVLERNVHSRRRNIEKKYNIILPVDRDHVHSTRASSVEGAVYSLKVKDGVVLVGSDAHIWPGPLSTMQRAFLRFAGKMKPVAVIANGDFFDGAQVSRHPTIGWETRPTVKQELDAVADYLNEIKRRTPRSKLIWPCGNHDMRFESRIANHAPELAKVKGVHLKDHFPGWTPCWRCDINDDVIVRHRELGGEHADFRNVQTAGKTIITGHDHRTGVVFWRNYTGLKYGVRCGFMGDSATDPQFVHYLECREPNWHPAFVVLTFKAGRLLTPELVTKHDDDHVEFRGEVINVREP